MTVRGSGGARFGGETLDRLLLVVFPNLEILGGQIADVVALFIGDDGVHQDQPGFRLEDRDRAAGGRRGLVLPRVRLGLGRRLLGLRQARDVHER